VQIDEQIKYGWIVALWTFALATCAMAQQGSGLECVITSGRTTYEVGDIPELTFRIINRSTKEVMLVGSLDGSGEGMRYPHCRVEINDKAGEPVTARYGRCGNMNSLRVADFVIVPPGQAFDPFGEGFFPPALLSPGYFPVKDPGLYSVRFHYSTSDRVQDYFGDERMEGLQSAPLEIQLLFERVPKVDLVSNELELTFLPKSE
jgi:hypothetical protein